MKILLRLTFFLNKLIFVESLVFFTIHFYSALILILLLEILSNKFILKSGLYLWSNLPNLISFLFAYKISWWSLFILIIILFVLKIWRWWFSINNKSLFFNRIIIIFCIPLIILKKMKLILPLLESFRYY